MSGWVARALMLFVVWIVLSGSHNVVHLLGGALLAFLVSWINRSPQQTGIRLRPWT